MPSVFSCAVIVAERAGLDPSGIEARLLSHKLIGALTVALEYWVTGDPDDPAGPADVGELAASVVPQGGKSEIRWSAEYESGDDAVATVEQIFGDGVYIAGLQAVQAHFA